MQLNLKNKIKNYGFWISLLSILFLITKHILNKCGIVIDEYFITEIISAFCFLLITLGVISNPESGKGFNDIKKDVKENINNPNLPKSEEKTSETTK